MSLDRVLSRFGLASRNEARAAILGGRLKVNGAIVRDPDRWVTPGRDVLHLDGTRLKRAQMIYLAFYKPKGVITSHGDPEGRRTVYDYLDRSIPWVSPVGRLDKDSSGLLLLTNDTEFATRITEPASRIEKTYLVKVNGLMEGATIERLAAGIRLKKGEVARPAAVRRIDDRGSYGRLEVVLTEGKNREIRRMMEAVGFKVLKLVRTRIGPVTLEGLQIGRWRDLTPGEVKEILRAGRPAAKAHLLQKA